MVGLKNLNELISFIAVSGLKDNPNHIVGEVKLLWNKKIVRGTLCSDDDKSADVRSDFNANFKMKELVPFVKRLAIANRKFITEIGDDDIIWKIEWRIK